MKHLQKDLLNYTCIKYFTDKKSNIHFNEEFVLISIINACGQYKYENENLQLLMTNLDQIIKPCKSKKMLNYALSYAFFNNYNISILKEIFNNEEYYFNATGRKFINLWQKLKTIPNYNGPEPSEKCIKKFTIWHTKSKFILLPYLEKGLGGSIYIRTNLKTKLQHQIGKRN
jgi:hypothetical protein